VTAFAQYLSLLRICRQSINVQRNALFQADFALTMTVCHSLPAYGNIWIWTVGISESEDQNDNTDEEGEAAEYATEDEPEARDETNEVVN